MRRIPFYTRPVVDHVLARKRSGLTVSEYCRQAGIAVHTYYYSRGRLAGRDPVSQTAAPPLDFVEVNVRPRSESDYLLRFQRAGVDLLIARGFDKSEVYELARVALALESGGQPC